MWADRRRWRFPRSHCQRWLLNWPVLIPITRWVIFAKTVSKELKKIISERLDPLMETFEIVPFKPLSIENPSYIWNVKCTFIACDNEDEDFCKLDDECAGRYDTIKASNVPERKRRSGDGKTAAPITVEKIVEHPCAYASKTSALCDGNGENCWTEEVCNRTYSSSAISSLSSALVIMSLFIK